MELRGAILRSLQSSRKTRKLPRDAGEETYVVTKIVLEVEGAAPGTLLELARLQQSDGVDCAIGLQLEMVRQR